MRGQWNSSPSSAILYLDTADLRDQNHSFEGNHRHHHDWIALTGGPRPERILYCQRDCELLRCARREASTRRFFRPEEETLQGEAFRMSFSAILGSGRRIFAGDPGIVGKPLEIAHHPGDGDAAVSRRWFRRCGAGAAARYAGHARSARNGRLADDRAQRELAGRAGKRCGRA